MNLCDLKQRPREKTKPEAFGYVSGNARAGDPARANRAALARRQITGFLRDVLRRDLSAELLGRRF